MTQSVEYKEVISAKDLVDINVELLKYLGEEYVKEDMHHTATSMIDTEMCVIVGAYDGDKIVGVFGLFVHPETFNYSQMRADELFWYVLPEYRGIGYELVNHVEKVIKADILSFGIQDERLLRYMGRKGFKAKKTIVEKRICAEVAEGSLTAY